MPDEGVFRSYQRRNDNGEEVCQTTEVILKGHSLLEASPMTGQPSNLLRFCSLAVRGRDIRIRTRTVRCDLHASLSDPDRLGWRCRDDNAALELRAAAFRSQVTLTPARLALKLQPLGELLHPGRAHAAGFFFQASSDDAT